MLNKTELALVLMEILVYRFGGLTWRDGEGLLSTDFEAKSEK